MGPIGFLIISSLFLFSPHPAHAFSIGDLFHPPIQMKQSQRQPPKEVVAPEVKSDDSFSNLNRNSEVCEWEDLLRNTWEPDPPEEETTTDSEGNTQTTLVWPLTPAENLEKEVNFEKMSNNYTRNTHDFAARGQIKCTTETERREFLSYAPGGDSSGNRSSNTRLAKWGRGQRYVDAIKSLDPDEDVIGMDEHVLYACGTECRELEQGPAPGCRPVTLGEVAYFYATEGIKKVYDDPVEFNLIDFPSNPQFANYPANYQKRFDKPLQLLDKAFYDRIDRQISPLSSGPVNQKIVRVAYEGYETDVHKVSPAPTEFKRNIPQAAASATKQTAIVWDQYVPEKSQAIDDLDSCGSVTVRGPNSVDAPPPLSILEYIRGVLHWFFGPSNWSNNPLEPQPHDSNEFYSYTEKQILENNHEYFEPFMAHMLPQKAHDAMKYSNMEQSSKVGANHPIDPGYRSDRMYANVEGGGQYSFANYMRPKSWQENDSDSSDNITRGDQPLPTLMPPTPTSPVPTPSGPMPTPASVACDDSGSSSEVKQYLNCLAQDTYSPRYYNAICSSPNRDAVIESSLAVGVNPLLSLVIWLHESDAGNYGDYDFGIKHPQVGTDFDSQINKFLSLPQPFLDQCSSQYPGSSDMDVFLARFSAAGYGYCPDPNSTTSNPQEGKNYIDNIQKFYNFISRKDSNGNPVCPFPSNVFVSNKTTTTLLPLIP